MLNITISPELKELCPALTLGCIIAEVTVTTYEPELWQEINLVCIRLKNDLRIEDVAQLKRLKDARDLYRRLGKDPTRYRISSDSLVRRVLKGQELYQVNNIVDINNLISLSSLYSIGCYDLEKISGNIILGIGTGTEEYIAIGRGLLNIDNLPVLSDNLGSFGSPTSDSERSMVTETTQRLLMNIISFSGEDGLMEIVKNATELLIRYAHGKHIETMIFS